MGSVGKEVCWVHEVTRSAWAVVPVLVLAVAGMVCGVETDMCSTGEDVASVNESAVVEEGCVVVVVWTGRSSIDNEAIWSEGVRAAVGVKDSPTLEVREAGGALTVGCSVLGLQAGCAEHDKGRGVADAMVWTSVRPGLLPALLCPFHFHIYQSRSEDVAMPSASSGILMPLL